MSAFRVIVSSVLVSAACIQPGPGSGTDPSPDAWDGIPLCVEVTIAGSTTTMTSATGLASPSPRTPWNGSSTGSVWAPDGLGVDPLRPRFTWDAVEGAVTYELEADDSCAVSDAWTCAFPSPELSVSIAGTEHVPDVDLPVSLNAPVGSRYVWRVRACDALACSLWSASRYVDVGRSAKDINGDGYADVLIGSPMMYQQFPKPEDLGHFFVYLGSALGPVALPIAVPDPDDQTGGGPTDYGQFGYSVAYAGDVNADGFADLVVGAPFQGEERAGRAFVYLGGPAGPSSATPLVLSSPRPALIAQFGTAVAAAGDVDGDGYADVIVGESRHGGGEPGWVYLFRGRLGGIDATEAQCRTDPSGLVHGAFGHSVRSAGDVNADGWGDVVVGAPFEPPSSAYVWHGAPTGVSDEHAFGYTTPSQFWDQLGESVSSAGDVDADGFGDVVIGSQGYMGIGEALLFRGGPTGLPAEPDVVFENPTQQTYSFFGTEVASARDVDADGFSDVLLGTESTNASVNGNGREPHVYAHRGSASGVDLEPAVRLDDPDGSNGQFGHAVAAAGDINGDGYDDTVVGAYAVSGTWGSVFVYLGGLYAWSAQPSFQLDNPLGTRMSFGISVD